MKITVTYIHSGRKKVFRGEPEHVQAQLHHAFRYLQRKQHGSLQQDLEYLGRQQQLAVEMEAE